ncbi:DUF6386 family protein [Shewanella sp. FJAT-51649]|uniref:DUF6386 family protein n=1 Tax=Shewanella sp. FJAT-51649 TaxID=2864210 RepID=UPI0021AC8985|nr:DUF6386 family protein [Shewanella sp. FJAT-51649]
MSKPYTSTRFDTDTATMAVFDPAALAHRCEDTADWWSVPSDEISEINQGHVLFVGLGADGSYEVEIFRKLGEAGLHGKYLCANLTVLSGCLYIGAAEQVPAGNLGPETTYGGALIYAMRGHIEVRVYRQAPNKLVVEFESTSDAVLNKFTSSPTL